MTEQLSFAGPAFRLEPVERPALFPERRCDQPCAEVLSMGNVRPTAEARKAALSAAHDAVTAAEKAMLIERSRPASREHWERLAHAYERRSAAWRLLAASWERDESGHAVRAMQLAAEADMAHARILRQRLAGAGR